MASVVVLIVTAAVAVTSDSSDISTDAAPNVNVTPLIPTTDSARPTTTSARTTSARTPTPPAPPPIPEAVVYSGSGDDVVAVAKPTAGAVLASITGNADGRYFSVQGIDGDQDLLVNTTDPYAGTTLMDIRDGETTQLQVTAIGPWTIILNSIAAAATFNGTFSGAGDGVLVYEGSAGVAQITGNADGRYFAVTVYTDTATDLLVNTVDPYDGRVPFPAGLAVVAITAADEWTIAVT